MHHQTKIRNETYLPPIDVPPAPMGNRDPRPCTCREYLLNQQEHGRLAPQDLDFEVCILLAPIKVHTASKLLRHGATAGYPRQARECVRTAAEEAGFSNLTLRLPRFLESENAPYSRSYANLMMKELCAKTFLPEPSHPNTSPTSPGLHSGTETRCRVTTRHDALISGNCMARTLLVGPKRSWLAASLTWGSLAPPKKTIATRMLPPLLRPANPTPRVFWRDCWFGWVHSHKPSPAASDYPGTPGTRVWVDITTRFPTAPAAETLRKNSQRQLPDPPRLRSEDSIPAARPALRLRSRGCVPCGPQDHFVEQPELSSCNPR